MYSLVNVYGCKRNKMFVYEESCAEALNSLFGHINIDIIHQVDKRDIVLIQDFCEKLYQAIEKARGQLITLLKSKNPNKTVKNFEDAVIMLFNYIKINLSLIISKTTKFYRYNFDIGHISKNFNICYSGTPNKWSILFYNDEIQ